MTGATLAPGASGYSSGARRCLFGATLLLFWGVYTLTASGHIYTIDSYQVYNVTKSLAERGTLEIPGSFMEVRGVQGRLYSKLGVGQSLLAYPLFRAAQLAYKLCPDPILDGIRRAQARVRSRLDGIEQRPHHLATWPLTRGDPFYSALLVLLFNPLVTALAMAVFALLVGELGHEKRSVLLTVAATGLGTFIWPHSRDFFQHPLVMLLLLTSVLLWVRASREPRPSLALKMGVAGGMALLTRVFTATWVPVLGSFLAIELLRARSGARRWLLTMGGYLLPLALAALVLALLNNARFGSPFNFGYHTEYDREGFSFPLLEGLRSNLMSTERSLLLFAPPLLVALPGMAALARRQLKLWLLTITLALLYLVAYSKWWAHDGGWCIGPRFLLPVVPLLMLPLARLLEKGGWWRRLTTCAALLFTAAGALLQLAWMSQEYTAMYILHHGATPPLTSYLRAIIEGGRQSLDFFYVNLWGQVPWPYYVALISLPLLLVVGGVLLLESGGRKTRSRCSPAPDRGMLPESCSMRAMVLDQPGQPLALADLPLPQPGPRQVRLRVHACGVCRTDLHIVDGELSEPVLPLVPGHQIVGTVVALGEGVSRIGMGDRVGVPWLGWTCGKCAFCASGRENLCDHARFTGYQISGGFAEQTVADERYCFPIPGGYPDLQAAPLLCAGLIGFRALRMAGEARRLGFFGFGAAAHILIQVARYQKREIYAFTRPGDTSGQAFARRLGAVWAGSSDERPPCALDAAILFAPVGSLVPAALRAVAKGGVVVCAGIHMSDIPSFPYAILWEERSVVSVANLTRRDGEAFLDLVPRVPVRTEVQPFPLAQANEALDALRQGRIEGAAVIVVD